jgi:hypothetical protein
MHMPDELRIVRQEGAVAVDMIRVHVGIDHPAHRPIGGCPHRRAQPIALDARAAGVDHRDAALPDHEAEVGDCPAVARRSILLRPVVHVGAVGDAGHRERRDRLSRQHQPDQTGSGSPAQQPNADGDQSRAHRRCSRGMQSSPAIVESGGNGLIS